MPDPTLAQLSGARDDRMRFWLSLVIVVGFVGFSTLMVFRPTALDRVIIGTIISAWALTMKDVSGYFFGSSSGSKLKTMQANPENKVTLTAPAAATTTVMKTDAESKPE